MGANDRARGVVHGPAETDAETVNQRTFNLRIPQELRNRRRNLPPDALGAPRRIDGRPPQTCERAVSAPKAQLKFRAANFDADVHGSASLVSRHADFIWPAVKRKLLVSSWKRADN